MNKRTKCPTCPGYVRNGTSNHLVGCPAIPDCVQAALDAAPLGAPESDGERASVIRSMRESVLEEAAKACDDYAAQCLESGDDVMAVASYHCAEVIRQMRGQA